MRNSNGIGGVNQMPTAMSAINSMIQSNMRIIVHAKKKTTNGVYRCICVCVHQRSLVDLQYPDMLAITISFVKMANVLQRVQNRFQRACVLESTRMKSTQAHLAIDLFLGIPAGKKAARP